MTTCSIVLATYNRAELLYDCLQHLSGQDFVAGDEVVVVDNGSTDRTAEILARQAAIFPVPLVRLFEPAPGKSRALATALAKAQGQLLAFTDDDVNVEPDWLHQIRTALTGGDIDVVGGPVAPRWERSAPAWLAFGCDTDYGRLAAPLALLNYGPSPVELGARTLLGANLAVRRQVLEQLGGFATHLGKLRGTLLSGEDHDFCRRAQAAGFRAIYSPAVRVSHWVPASRMRLRYFLSWFYWSGVTNAALDADAAAPARPFAESGGKALRPVGSAVLRAASALAQGESSAALHRMLDAAFAAGYAAHRWGFSVTSGGQENTTGGTKKAA